MTNDVLRELCELLQDIPDNTVSIEAMKLAKKTAKGCLSLLAERDKLKEEVERLESLSPDQVKLLAINAELEGRLKAEQNLTMVQDLAADDMLDKHQQVKARLQATREALEPFAHVEMKSDGNFYLWGHNTTIKYFRRAKAVFEDKDYDN